MLKRKYSFRQRRLVFMRPSMNIDEFLSQEASDAVRLEGQAQKSFEAMKVSEIKQAQESTRLGVAQQLAITLEKDSKDSAAEQIHQEALHQTERAATRQEIEDMRLRQSWVGSKFGKLWGCVLNNTVGLVSENYDEVGWYLRGKYSNQSKNRLRSPVVRESLQKKYILAERVWNDLSPTERMNVDATLTRLGVNTGPMVLPAYARNAGIFRLASASMLQLQQLQEAHAFLPQRNPTFYPGTEPVVPKEPFLKLMKLAGQSDENRRETLHTTVFDTKRLQTFFDDLKNSDPTTSKLLLEEVLEDNAFFSLQNNPTAQSLASYLAFRYEHPSTPSLKDELENAKKAFPAKKEETEGENQAKIDRIKSGLDTLLGTANQLKLNYKTAKTIGEQLVTAENNQKANPGKMHIENALNSKQNAHLQATKTISDLETKYLDVAVQLKKETKGVALPAPIRTLVDNFCDGLTETDEEDLFGTSTGTTPGKTWTAPRDAAHLPANSIKGRILNHVSSSNVIDVKEAFDEADLSEKVRLSCKQLLLFLKAADFERKGVTNPEEKYRLAHMATSLMVADAQNMQLFMSTNQELAERIGGKTLASNKLDRLRKYLIAKTTDRQIYTARDIIDELATRDKKFRVFYEMPQDITLAQLRDRLVQHDAMDPGMLTEYNFMLLEVYKSFEILQTDGQVELFDGDAMDLQRLIKTINVVKAEIRSNAFFQEVREHGGDKVELIVKKMAEDDVAIRKEEDEILGSVMDKGSKWRLFFNKVLLRKATMAPLMDKRQFIKENKLGKHEAEESLWESGLKGANNAFGTMIAIGGLLHSGREVAGWTWENVVKKLGKYGVYKPATYLWSPFAWSGSKLAKTWHWAGSLLSRKK